MPVLLYGSENWILTEGRVAKLEAFQAELVKRILKWPRHFSNTAALTALEVPTMKCRILERKLGFLRQVIGREGRGLSVQVRESFCDEISSLSLVKECKELEEKMMTRYTENILRGEAVEHRGMREKIKKNDKKIQFSCVQKSPLIAEVAKDIGWSKLWDTCLSFGEKYTAGLQKLSQVMHEPPLKRTVSLPTV